jgi:hypothetical protein
MLFARPREAEKLVIFRAFQSQVAAVNARFHHVPGHVDANLDWQSFGVEAPSKIQWRSILSN